MNNDLVYCINVIVIIVWEIIRMVKKLFGGWFYDFFIWIEFVECLINYLCCVYYYLICRRFEMMIKENIFGIGEC